MGFAVTINVEVFCDEHPGTGAYAYRKVRVELPLEVSTRDPEAYRDLVQQLGENVADAVRGCARTIRNATRAQPAPVKKREASEEMKRARERLMKLPSCGRRRP